MINLFLDVQLYVIDVSFEFDLEKIVLNWMKVDLVKLVDLGYDFLFNEVLFIVEFDCFFWYQCIYYIVIDGFGFFLIVQCVVSMYIVFMKG